jgi:hypothetical protein
MTAPSIAATISVATEPARSASTPCDSNAAASTSFQRVKAAPAAARAPGERSPSSVAATTGQPAAKSLSARICRQSVTKRLNAATGSLSLSASATASPAAT